MLIFLLNGLVFILIGLQLPGILAILNSTIAQRSPILLVWDAALVSLTVILVRLVWAFPQALLPRLLSRRLRERDPYPGWRPSWRSSTCPKPNAVLSCCRGAGEIRAPSPG